MRTRASSGAAAHHNVSTSQPMPATADSYRCTSRIYRWQIQMVSSILHRATGIALAAGIDPARRRAARTGFRAPEP